MAIEIKNKFNLLEIVEIDYEVKGEVKDDVKDDVKGEVKDDVKGEVKDEAKKIEDEKNKKRWFNFNNDEIKKNENFTEVLPEVSTEVSTEDHTEVPVEDTSEVPSEEESVSSEESDNDKKRWFNCDRRDSSDSSDCSDSDHSNENQDFIYVLYDNDHVKTYSESYDKLNDYLEKLIKNTASKYIHLGDIYVHPEIKKEGNYYKVCFIHKNMFWNSERVLKIFSIKKIYGL